MSTFAEWKKTNKVMDKCIPDGYQAMAYVVAQAAYKAGERQGRKDAETLEHELSKTLKKNS